MRPQRHATRPAARPADPKRRDFQSTQPPRWRWQIPILVMGLALAIGSGVIAYRIGGPYGEGMQKDRRVRQVFSEETGATEVVVYDIDGDLRFDRWSYMDGQRVIRTEYDDDGDGRIDHWEYFRSDGTTERLEADTDGNGRFDWRIRLDSEGMVTSEETP